MNVWITGGAGFIGCNTAQRMLEQGHQVTIFDNLSRPGSEKNLQWLQGQNGDLDFKRVDVRDEGALGQAFAASGDPDLLFHFAAQVAVTTSVLNPREDFEINALGTFNVLEAVRQLGIDPVIFYASTNKVYGEIEGLQVVEDETRYRYLDLPAGVNENTQLDFHSPYGCSKGAADQYMRDYQRIYGLRSVVFRNSCIYGPRQFGIEDQGWLAWFVIAAALQRPITIYGNGKQVRDVLYVGDLIDAMLAAHTHIEQTAGQVYNIGGGPQNSISVWVEFQPLLEEFLGRPVPVAAGDWRPGDQRIYISDVSKAQRDFGWKPLTNVRQGIRLLADWILDNQKLFR